MPLSPLSYGEIKRRLELLGFQIVSRRGSQVKFAKETQNGRKAVIVPEHRKVAVGTSCSIIRQSGVSISEFESL